MILCLHNIPPHIKRNFISQDIFIWQIYHFQVNLFFHKQTFLQRNNFTFQDKFGLLER